MHSLNPYVHVIKVRLWTVTVIRPCFSVVSVLTHPCSFRLCYVWLLQLCSSTSSELQTPHNFIFACTLFGTSHHHGNPFATPTPTFLTPSKKTIKRKQQPFITASEEAGNWLAQRGQQETTSPKRRPAARRWFTAWVAHKTKRIAHFRLILDRDSRSRVW